MLFHEAVAHALADQGVSHVFGVIGDANLFMVDSFERRGGGRFLSVSNEAGGVLAANGYARTSGRLGVATVTHGPALTNAVTALVESVRDRTPLLLLAGDTAVADKDNLQNIPQREVVLATGAGFEQVRAPHTLGDDMSVAVRRAIVEQRPVVLNVPVDFQWEEVDFAPQAPRVVPPQEVGADPSVLDRVVGMIASARRPLVLAGRGATSARARGALLRLANRIGAPVATTLRAKDLFRGHIYDIGICGTLSSSVALDVIDRSDCVIAFGASLNRWTAAEGAVLAGKKVVQVDVDPEGVNRSYAADLAVIGDAGSVADTIVDWLDRAEVPPTGFASDELAEQLRRSTDAEFVDRSTDVTVDLRSVLKQIDTAFPAERTLVFDGGRWIFDSFTMLHVLHPSAYVHTVNFGSIGLGMGNAIGAWFGAPERPVLLITGDGGFMMGGLAELNTAVRHGVDLVVFVMNDGAYGAEHIQFRNRKMDPAISTFAWPDFAPVATALGGEGYTVRNLEQLAAVLHAIPARTKPVLVDVKIDPDKVAMGGH